MFFSLRYIIQKTLNNNEQYNATNVNKKMPPMSTKQCHQCQQNNATNVNKTNNYLAHLIIDQKITTTYEDAYAQKSDGAKLWSFVLPCL